MIIIQVRLRADVFLRARVTGTAEPAVAFSIGPEQGVHAVAVSDASAHVLMLMLQLVPRT